MFQADFQIRFLPKNEGHITHFHFHDEIEFLIPVTQGGQFWIENAVYPLFPGTLFIVNEHVLHHLSNTIAPYARYVIHVTPAELEKLSSSKTNFLHSLAHTPRALNIGQHWMKFIDLLEVLNTPPQGIFGEEISQTMHFLTFLLETCRLLDQVPQAAELSGDDTVARVVSIQKFIQDNCNRPLALDEIASHFYISKYHLCHLFKEFSKYSVIEFLNYCRITRACKLLRNQVPPTQAGEEAGFQSNVQFIRVFKQWTGMTPTRYSKQFSSTSYIGYAERPQATGSQKKQSDLS